MSVKPMASRITPEQIRDEFERGVRFKNALGKRGLYEQSVINERFFVGDQWHGAHCGDDRPLVRHNVIKRIGDFKMATVGVSPLSVSFSAEGMADTADSRRRINDLRHALTEGQDGGALFAKLTDREEVPLVMAALSEYFRITAERVDLEEIKETALRNAYCSGTGVVYTYWDSTIDTGLYADVSRKTPIRGDIACEVIDIENVYFGDPSIDDVQRQPYILIAQRRTVQEVRRQLIRSYGRRKGAEMASEICCDRDVITATGSEALDGGEQVTVLTRFWKEYGENGRSYVIKAMQVTGSGMVVRPEWVLGTQLYPFAKFSWERRRGCIYGDSEITYLIPNQIAINRMLTASVWAVMVMGMPIMMVNGDLITQPVTNDPGQVVQVFGGSEDVQRAIRYVDPPAFSPQFDDLTASLISNTLTQSGANSAALGDVRPDNTSAIIAVREAATMPLQMIQNRFYHFFEDLARIWADFWVNLYGKRLLRVQEENGSWYLPFDGRRYRRLLIRARVDTGAATVWSESQTIKTLDNLLDRQVIDTAQYLSRLPKGIIPDVNGLLREKPRQESAEEKEE